MRGVDVSGDRFTTPIAFVGMLSHVGLHVDAFLLMRPDMWPDWATIEAMPLATFMGCAGCLDRYRRLLRRRLAHRERMRLSFERFGILLTPTTPCPAWSIDVGVPSGHERGVRSGFTYPFDCCRRRLDYGWCPGITTRRPKPA